MMELVRMTPALQTVIRVLYILAYQYISYIKDTVDQKITLQTFKKNYFECVQIYRPQMARSQYANVQCPIRKQQYNVDAWTYVICHLPELQPTQGSWMNRDRAQSITLLLIDTLGAQTVTRQSTRYMFILTSPSLNYSKLFWL